MKFIIIRRDINIMMWKILKLKSNVQKCSKLLILSSMLFIMLAPLGNLHSFNLSYRKDIDYDNKKYNNKIRDINKKIRV